MNNIKEALDERIVNGLDELNGVMDPKNREARGKEIESLSKAYAEVSKVDIEAEKASVEKKSKLLSFILGLIGTLSSIFLTVWGVKKTFEFEKEGTITSCLGRGLINKLLPRSRSSSGD